MSKLEIKEFLMGKTEIIPHLGPEIYRIIQTLFEVGVISEPWALITDESYLSDFSLEDDEILSFEKKLGLPRLEDENISIVNIALMLKEKN